MVITIAPEPKFKIETCLAVNLPETSVATPEGLENILSIRRAAPAGTRVRVSGVLHQRLTPMWGNGRGAPRAKGDKAVALLEQPFCTGGPGNKPQPLIVPEQNKSHLDIQASKGV